MQKDLTVSCMGVALQTVIPKMIHKKITAFFELIKPLVEFKVNPDSNCLHSLVFKLNVIVRCDRTSSVSL